MNNINDDLLTRSLAQLAGDPATDTEAAREAARFAAALQQLRTDPDEADRINAIAASIDLEVPTRGTLTSGHDSPDKPDTARVDAASVGTTRTRVRPSMTHVLGRLAGAEPDVLTKAPTDRVKYAAIGGVLLTTAGVAGVSAAFALSTAVQVPAYLAVVVGALWGVVIFNLDRLLIVTIRRQKTWRRNVLMAIPRLILAILIGSIISVPLLLRVFQPEIDSELNVIHAENVTVAQKALNDQFGDIAITQQRLDELQAVAAGSNPASVTSDPDVIAAQTRVKDAQDIYNAAVTAATCEIDGTCGTRVPGTGASAHLLQQQADQARQQLKDATAALDAATATAQARIAGSTAAQAAAAKAEISSLQPQLDARKDQRARAQARITSAEEQSDGLLARLEALTRLSSHSAVLRTTQLALLALLMLIEVLPVLVRLLSMTGPADLYDQLLEDTELTLADLSKRRDQLEQQVLDEQNRRAAEAATKLIEAQQKVAENAIATWEEIATDPQREDEADWYHQLAVRNLQALSQPDTEELLGPDTEPEHLHRWLPPARRARLGTRPLQTNRTRPTVGRP